MPYCKICKKDYKSRQSFYGHNKRFHSTPIEENYCQHCGKCFTRKDNLDRHIKTCKSNPDYIKNTIMDNNIKAITEQLDLDPLEVQDIINKQKKNPYIVSENINSGDDENNLSRNSESQNQNNHSLNSMTNSQNPEITNSNLNSNNNTDSNNNSNSNNTTNNINIITLGNENLSEVLSKKEQIEILNKRCKCLEYIIQQIHASDKYPQFHNILVDDLKSNKGKVFDTESGEFKVIKKRDLYHDLIENRLNDIEEFKETYSGSIKKYVKADIEKIVNEIIYESDDPKSQILKEIKDDIDVLLYNGRNTVKKTHKLKLKPIRRTN